MTLALGDHMQDLKQDTRQKLTCDTMYCAIGAECVERYGIAECECIKRCMGDAKPVCGSNGTHTKTYKSLCHLQQASCLQKEIETIKMVAAMSCEEGKEKEKMLTKEIEMDQSKPKPIVCMQQDRDNIREAIIGWLKKELKLGFNDISYKGLLLKYFNMLDTDGDGALDTMEFMKLLEKDDSISKKLSTDTYSNPILRGLCLSELMAITDVNSDYKLEFDEFHKCLHPSFYPPKEECDLDGVAYDEGDVIPQGCNTCKCACGHWVCTQLKCEKEKEDH